MIIEKKAKNTLTPFEINKGDVLKYTKVNGELWDFSLTSTDYKIVSTTLKSLETTEKAAKTVYSFSCQITVNGNKYTLEREIPTQNSFYEPWEIDGVFVWFDAISDVYKKNGGVLVEKDMSINIKCEPNKHARFAIQDMSLDILPEKIYDWMSLPEGCLNIEDCYRGEDCWMGTYDGLETHGGLDVNHEVGLPIYAPIDFDDQYYFDNIEKGATNNRWRGIRVWDNGSKWILQVHHMISLTVEEHTPVKGGVQIAKGGGVAYGDHYHSHFVFAIEEDGEHYFIDPWILFWRMYKNK